MVNRSKNRASVVAFTLSVIAIFVALLGHALMCAHVHTHDNEAAATSMVLSEHTTSDSSSRHHACQSAHVTAVALRLLTSHDKSNYNNYLLPSLTPFASDTQLSALSSGAASRPPRAHSGPEFVCIWRT